MPSPEGQEVILPSSYVGPPTSEPWGLGPSHGISWLVLRGSACTSVRSRKDTERFG